MSKPNDDLKYLPPGASSFIAGLLAIIVLVGTLLLGIELHNYLHENHPPECSDQ